MLPQASQCVFFLNAHVLWARKKLVRSSVLTVVFATWSMALLEPNECLHPSSAQRRNLRCTDWRKIPRVAIRRMTERRRLYNSSPHHTEPRVSTVRPVRSMRTVTPKAIDNKNINLHDDFLPTIYLVRYRLFYSIASVCLSSVRNVLWLNGAY